MILSSEELEDFKKTYENAFDIRLSDEGAHELADELKQLYRTVLRRSTPINETPRQVRPPWEGQAEGHPLP